MPRAIPNRPRPESTIQDQAPADGRIPDQQGAGAISGQPRPLEKARASHPLQRSPPSGQDRHDGSKRAGRVEIYQSLDWFTIDL